MVSQVSGMPCSNGTVRQSPHNTDVILIRRASTHVLRMSCHQLSVRQYLSNRQVPVMGQSLTTLFCPCPVQCAAALCRWD